MTSLCPLSLCGDGPITQPGPCQGAESDCRLGCPPRPDAVPDRAPDWPRLRLPGSPLRSEPRDAAP